MINFKPVLRTSALALAASAPAAWADVTAEDVWGQFKGYFEASGPMFSVGSEAKVGNVLTVTDLQVAMDAPEVGMTATISEMTFTENGDGTVTVTLPPEYPMSLTMKPAGEEGGTMTMAVRQTGLTTIASGTPETINYAVAGEQVSVSVEDMTMDEAGPVDMTLEIAFGGITGNYSLGSGDVRPFNSSMNAATVSLTMDMADPEGGTGRMQMSAEAANLTSSSSGTLPQNVNYADMAAMLAAGMDMTGTLNYGAATFELNFQDETESFAASGSVESGGGDFDFGPGGISYGSRSTGLDMSVSGSDIPLPSIDVQMEESGFGLTMPVAKSDTPQDIGLLIRMVGLSVNDEIWGMIDPGGALPHDPATLIIDLSGTANWLIDIMAPDAEQQMAAGGMPGQIHSLNVDELKLEIAGADLTGTGAFTFDNTDLMTWGGMPAPTGSVDLQLVGGNGLLDKLVTMGLLPQDQAMGARMMMGLFARPGDGPDTLVSKIEVQGNGSVFANGQQLK